MLIVSSGSLSGAVIARELIDFGSKVNVFHLIPSTQESQQRQLEQERAQTISELLPEARVEMIDFAHDPERLSHLYRQIFDQRDQREEDDGKDNHEDQNRLDTLIIASNLSVCALDLDRP